MRNNQNSQQLTIQQAISRAKKAIKQGNTAVALELYTAILQQQPHHPFAKKALRKLQKGLPQNQSAQAETTQPSQDQIAALVNLYQSGQMIKAEQACRELLQTYPQSLIAINVLGLALQGQGKLQEAVQAYDKAIQLKPDFAEAYSNRGNTLKELGQLDAAVKSYEKALAIKSDYAGAHYNLGNTLQKLGQLDAAVKSYEEALVTKPDFAEAHNNLGHTLKELGQLDEALKSCDKAIQHKPDFAEAYSNRGNALKDLGQLEEAIQNYDRAIQLKPDYAEAHNNRGVALKDLGQLEEAMQNCDKAIQLKPDFAEAYSNRGNTLKELGQLDAAVKSYEKALAIKSDYAGAHYNLGNTLQKLGQLDAAVKSYEKALAIKSDYAEAHSNLGNTLQELGQLDEALKSCDKAIQLKPDFAEAYSTRGNALKDLGRLDEAVASYDKAIQLKPDYAEAHNNRGVALKDLGQLEEAMQNCDKAIQLKPDFAEAYSNRGNTLKELGQLDAAVKSYEKALAIKSDYAEAHSNLGNTLQELGQLDEALKSCDKAIQLKPDFAEAYSTRGNALKDLGRLDEAVASYDKAIQLKPDYAEAYSNRGITLTDLGRLDEALQNYNKAIQLKPDYAGAWNNVVFPLQAIKTQISSDDKLRSLYPEDTNSKYAQIEKSILNYKLHLGGKNAENLLNEALSTLASAENITIKNPAGDKVAAGLDLRLPDKVIAMMHFGRSGTGLLHSLIDGHSEVSTLPSIYLSQYFLHSNWEKIISGGWGEMANRFVAIYEVLFNAASTVPIESKSRQLLHNIGQKEGMANVGDHQNEVLSVDKTLFRAELNRLMGFYDELDAFVFFKLVHAAYDKAINDLNQKNLLFYHIHNPDTYAQLNFLRSAPDGRGLIMVREPVQSCESWSRRHFLDNNHTKIVNRILIMLFDIDSIVYHKCNSIGVRLEDIKESPRQTISALCKWMGIKEAESLYEMTAQGKKWWGDPTSQDFKKDGMDPFGKTSINRKVGSIFSEKDQFILRTLYYPFSVRFGYVQANFEQFKVDLQTIRPMLDQMFDFEKTLVKRTQVDPKQFMKSGSYLYLRSGLVERWNTLNEFHTYPNMIEPLRIVSE